MKISRLLVAALSLVLLMSFVSIALAAPEVQVVPKTNVQVKTPPVVNITNCCPAGWHLTHGACTGAFACAPNKPAPVKCPGSGKYGYFDNGCSVGCQEIIK
ncbi:MAG: hypothetical protein H6Q52_1574 [Deltaproteobacteria bacterium]|nr:hypothetical protein [Deltaproteobacteria bacterium]